MPIHEEGESDDDLFDRQLRLTIEGDRRGTAWRRALVLANGMIAGCFNITRMDRAVTLEGEVSWWVRGDLAGRGLATAGGRALLRHALTPAPGGLGLYRIVGGVLPGNSVSEHVAMKCGLRRSGGPSIRRRPGGGGWAEHVTYTITADDLERQRAAG